FSFSACKFNVQKSKEGTGRVVMWKMGIRNSFTLEATFCGSTLGNKRGTHFSTKDLESMGYHFCDSLLDYCDPDRSKYFQCLKELEEMEKHINLERALDDSDNSLVEIPLNVESSSRGSDSSESNDTQTYLLKLTSKGKNKRKYLKTNRERDATLAKHQRSTREAYGKERLLQRQEESNSDVKVKIPEHIFYPQKTHSSSQRMNQSLNKHQRTYILEPSTSPIQEAVQSKGLDMYESCFQVASLKCPMNKQASNWMEKTRIPTESHHELKRKAKRRTSSQSKRAGTNWTDDEKRIYRDKRIAETQEILQYLLPMVESSKTIKSTQMQDLFNPGADFQQHQNLMTNTSEWLQSLPQNSLESFSPLCNLQKKKKHPELCARDTEDVMLPSSKQETVPSRSKMDADIVHSNSLQPEESILRSSEQMVPRLTKTNKKPTKSDGRSPSI
ncbi:hypothetical protein STEG23_021050, partial [Scotinomys teguina]